MTTEVQVLDRQTGIARLPGLVACISSDVVRDAPGAIR